MKFRYCFYEFIATYLFTILISATELSILYNFSEIDVIYDLLLSTIYVPMIYGFLFILFSRIEFVVMNPCLGFGMWICGQYSFLTMLGCILLQVAGAILGSLTAAYMFIFASPDGSNKNIWDIVLLLKPLNYVTPFADMYVGELILSFVVTFFFFALLYTRRRIFRDSMPQNIFLKLMTTRKLQNPKENDTKQPLPPSELIKRVLDTPTYQKLIKLEQDIIVLYRDLSIILSCFVFVVSYMICLFVGIYLSATIYNPVRIILPLLLTKSYDKLGFLVLFEVTGGIMATIVYFFIYLRDTQVYDKNLSKQPIGKQDDIWVSKTREIKQNPPIESPTVKPQEKPNESESSDDFQIDAQDRV